MANEELLTVRQVARECGRSEETVRRWIWSGKLPARKIGNQLFVERSALKDRLSERPALHEARLEYAPVQYNREEALRNFHEAVELGKKLAEKYGPTDVSRLLRESRGEEA